MIGSWSCGGSTRPGIDNGFERSPNVSAAILKEGRSLAETHCQGCHAFPEPDLLDKESWERYVLPTMGYRLGLYHRDPGKAKGIRSELIENGLAGELVLQAKVFPENPAISAADFSKITDYYLAAAPAAALPAALPAGLKPAVASSLKLFRPVFPDLPFRPASAAVVKIDSVGQQLYVGLAYQNLLLQLNPQRQLKQTYPLQQAASDYLVRPEGNYALNIGSIFPSDAPAGALTFYPPATQKPVVVLNNLQRPVQAQFADLNQDNHSDLLVCEFGNQTGSLSWYAGKKDQRFEKHILRKTPGAVRAYIKDFNGDNRPDIMALMAQGNEGIFMYYNQGQGRFREEQVLQFSPAIGSSYFELIDFNRDGHLDILYTAGDNADFLPVKKRYHGIYIYLNNGQNAFTQGYFYPLHGAYKAVAADFDQDGDLDIAAIAFFARFQEKSPASFIYLQQEGHLTFTAATFPGSNRGRWLTLDKGDLDGDGDLDLVLGSFVLKTQLATAAQIQDWAAKGPVVVILQNKSR